MRSLKNMGFNCEFHPKSSPVEITFLPLFVICFSTKFLVRNDYKLLLPPIHYTAQFREVEEEAQLQTDKLI